MEAQQLDNTMEQVNVMFNCLTNCYQCTCGKVYKTLGFFKRHLTNVHYYIFSPPDDMNSQLDSKDSHDHVAIWKAAFMKMALILRDTTDAYKQGDGNRVFLNAKFEMLYASVARHSKYKLWLWRFLAYEASLLTPKQAEDYKWNCSANLRGGIGNNIPNDNLVELMVQQVKKRIKEQGTNFTYDSARKVVKSTQIQEELKENVADQISGGKKGKKITKHERSVDVALIVEELLKGNVFGYVPGRSFDSFLNYKTPFDCIKFNDLHTWITKQKQRAAAEII